MSDGSPIEWTDATWNPITGCSVHSPGCTNCYAMKLAGSRMRHHPSRAGLTIDTNAGPVWNGQVRFNEAWLDEPLRWKKPRMIFVCAHADLFHENVPDAWIDRVVAIMARAQHHRFQVLTKRADRMRRYWSELPGRIHDWACDAGLDFVDLPLPNVWLGVSVEDQKRADERIPHLLETPAAVRWLSMEPLLGPVDLTWITFKNERGGTEHYDALDLHLLDGETFPDDCCSATLDWVVLGGESGPCARPMHPDWARAIRDQCANAGVPFHFKQWGSWLPWQPAQLSCFKSQRGDLIDRHELPDFNEAGLKAWTDRFLYEGDEICIHQFVGKKAAGRLLDGVEHNEFPARRAA